MLAFQPVSDQWPLTSDWKLLGWPANQTAANRQTVAPLSSILVTFAQLLVRQRHVIATDHRALFSSYVITAEPHCCSSLTIPTVTSPRRDKTPNVISYKLFYWRWDQVREWNPRTKQINGRHRVKAIVKQWLFRRTEKALKLSYWAEFLYMKYEM